MRLRSLFRPSRPVPVEYRANFWHLYMDIAWFGVLSASAVSFVAVYATHQGASPFQIGLLSAGPAVVNLLITLPSGRWLERRPIDTATFWAAVLQRGFYLLWVPLPLLLAPEQQVWALILLTLVMSMPATVLAIAFNALFAEAVPPEWRGYVVGVRNALLSVIFILVSLICGEILDRVPFPLSYQVVFAMGVLGGAMSTLHLWFVVPRPDGKVRARVGRSLGDLASPGVMRTVVDGLRSAAGLRFLLRGQGARYLRTEILRGPFGKLLAVLFAFHLAVHLAIPLFPSHWVNNMHLSDREIALGTAFFYVSVFVGSIQLDRLTRRFGNQRLTATGAMFMAGYPGLLSIGHGLGLYLAASIVGGFGWSLVGGALVNYVLEKTPEDHRPSYLAWYNLELNAALLLGSLIGPLVAGFTGVPLALAIFACLRFAGALGILLWE